MAGAFSADSDWMDQFCNQLNSSTCSLQAALDALKETGPIRTGHEDLDDACGKFHDRWGHGLKVMNKAVSVMSEKVTERAGRGPRNDRRGEVPLHGGAGVHDACLAIALSTTAADDWPAYAEVFAGVLHSVEFGREDTR